jgi:hypothetical protein
VAPPLTGAERQARYRARHPGYDAQSNARRVWVGRLYVGRTHTQDSAKQLNDETRRHFNGRT